MSKGLDKELLEVAQWYTYTKSSGMSIEGRLDFLIKAVDFLIWTQAKAAEDLQVLEGRHRRGEALHDPYVMRAIPKNLRTATGNMES